MNIKKKKLALVTLASLMVVAALYIPAKSVVGNSLECKRIHDNLRSENKEEIDQVNSLEIFGSKEPEQAKVSTHGGCGSINPLGIEISKSYDGDINGGEALTSVRNNLKNAGYTFNSENFGSEGCKAIYRMQASKDGVRLYVALFQEKKRITGCASGRPSGLSEEVFSEQILEKALVKPI